MGIGMRPERFVHSFHSDGAKGWMEWNGMKAILGSHGAAKPTCQRSRCVCVSIYLLIDSFLSYIYIYLYRSVTAIVGVLDLDVCGRCRAMAWLRCVALRCISQDRDGMAMGRGETSPSDRLGSNPNQPGRARAPPTPTHHTICTTNESNQHCLGDHESIHPSILEDQTNEPMHQPQTTC